MLTSSSLELCRGRHGFADRESDSSDVVDFLLPPGGQSSSCDDCGIAGCSLDNFAKRLAIWPMFLLMSVNESTISVSLFRGKLPWALEGSPEMAPSCSLP